MTMSLNSAVVRICAPDGLVVGAGFLVNQWRILTCAHVIAQVLRTPEDASRAPLGKVGVDFPLIASGHVLTAHIIHWQPEIESSGWSWRATRPPVSELQAC